MHTYDVKLKSLSKTSYALGKLLQLLKKKKRMYVRENMSYRPYTHRLLWDLACGPQSTARLLASRLYNVT